MTYNKETGKNLKKWTKRLKNSTTKQFPNELKFLLRNIYSNPVLKGIIFQATENYSLTNQELNDLIKNLHYKFHQMDYKNLEHQASICYQLTNRLINEGHNIHERDEFFNGTFKETQQIVINELIEPIINYLIDFLEESNSVLYLLEKYKRKVEWFTGKNLKKTYQELNANYEDFLEDDLRLFLFEQGIDYPFSTPKTSSGRSDVVGSIDSSDPLIVEIKIFDSEKKYGKERIRKGFSQILRYTEDYNKNQGFLVVYNLDKVELNFDLEQDNFFPPMLNYNNKTYFFIVINVSENIASSQIDKSRIINISKDDLVS